MPLYGTNTNVKIVLVSARPGDVAEGSGSTGKSCSDKPQGSLLRILNNLQHPAALYMAPGQ